MNLLIGFVGPFIGLGLVELVAILLAALVILAALVGLIVFLVRRSEKHK
jgi:hypothetical protein